MRTFPTTENRLNEVQTAFANETQDIILRGIVRPADITAGNTVFSYNGADVTIRIVSMGAIPDKALGVTPRDIMAIF